MIDKKMIKKAVVFFVAPIGNGPAGDAVRTISALPVEIIKYVIASESVLKFIKDNAVSDVCVGNDIVDSLLTEEFVFVCMNHLPWANRLHAAGLGHRTIFFDSIFLWRQWRGQSVKLPNLRAYFAMLYPPFQVPDFLAFRENPVNDFPDSFLLFDYDRVSKSSAVKREHILVNISGHGHNRSAFPRALIQGIVELSRESHYTWTIVSSANLSALESHERCSVHNALRKDAFDTLLASSALLVTTPGAGVVKSSINHGVNFLVLPPLNSTQIHHYLSLVKEGVDGAYDIRKDIDVNRLRSQVRWEQHEVILNRLYSSETKSIVGSVMSRLRYHVDRPEQCSRRFLKSYSYSCAENESVVRQDAITRAVVALLADNV